MNGQHRLSCYSPRLRPAEVSPVVPKLETNLRPRTAPSLGISPRAAWSCQGYELFHGPRASVENVRQGRAERRKSFHFFRRRRNNSGIAEQQGGGVWPEGPWRTFSERGGGWQGDKVRGWQGDKPRPSHRDRFNLHRSSVWRPSSTHRKEGINHEDTRGTKEKRKGWLSLAFLRGFVPSWFKLSCSRRAVSGVPRWSVLLVRIASITPAPSCRIRRI